MAKKRKSNGRQSPDVERARKTIAAAFGLKRYQVKINDLCKMAGLAPPPGAQGKGWRSRALVEEALRIRLERGDRVIPGWGNLRLEVFKRDAGVCGYCRLQADELHCDHIHPWSLGGSSDLSNLVTACRSCNLAKSDRVLSRAQLQKVHEFVAAN